MKSLFNFNTICTKLDPKTRSFHITLNRPEKSNHINFELLFELETSLNWAYSRVEIQSIFINSSTDIFSIGIELDSLKNLQHQKVKKYREHVLRIHELILAAPQIIIFDLGKLAKNIGLELSFAADVIIAHNNALLELNNHQLGLPIFHNSEISRAKIGHQFINNCLNARLNCVEVLKNSGFIAQTYQNSTQELAQKILKNCLNQSPLTKTQTKSIFNYQILNNIKKNCELEDSFFNASISIQDWKNEKFSSPREVKSKVELTLIQGEAE